MKAWKEFMEFTNLKGQVKNFVMLLMLTSFLYCSVYTILANFMYWNGNTLLFYGILYVLVIVSAYVYMLVLYQFLKKKRDDDLRVDMKACRIPLIMTQSVFFLLMDWGQFCILLTYGKSRSGVFTISIDTNLAATAYALYSLASICYFGNTKW